MHFGRFGFGKPGHFGPPWGVGPQSGGPGFFQARRGDMRPIILKVLVDGPLHGYEIMKNLEEKSHGMWRPSPGSVYPTLQLLEDEDLIVGEDKAGKKVYALTEAGRQEAQQSTIETPWDAEGNHMKRFMEFRELGSQLFGRVHTIMRTGTDQDVAQLRTILTRVKDELTELTKQKEPTK